VASEHAVLVSTRPDEVGNVQVRVLEGDDGHDLGSKVFDGELSVVSGHVIVGSVLAGQVLDVGIAHAGYVSVKIFVDPVELPERIAIVIGGDVISA
jgi:hypothetical protein